MIFSTLKVAKFTLKVKLCKLHIYIIILTYYFLILAGACATSENILKDSYQTSHDLMLVWPSPPQKPRIQYIKSISSPVDIGMQKS